MSMEPRGEIVRDVGAVAARNPLHHTRQLHTRQLSVAKLIFLVKSRAHSETGPTLGARNALLGTYAETSCWLLQHMGLSP